MFSFRKYFSTPTAGELAQTSLAEYERSMLIHQATAAYSLKMAEYYKEGIDRLVAYTTPKPAKVAK